MKKLLIFSAVLVCVLGLSTSRIYAQIGGEGQPGQGGGQPSSAGQPQAQKISFKFANPFNTGDDLWTLMKKIVDDIIMPIGGVLAVLAFIFSGFKYVTAMGKPDKLQEANRMLLYTAIGTAILLGAWVISQVILNTINQVIT